MFRGLGNVAKLMGSLGEIQERMAAMKESLADLKVEGTAGGGMVTVEATGAQQITRISIEESLITSGDREMIEELTMAAVNQALEKAREAAAEEMGKVAGDLEIPGMGNALSQLGLDGTGG